jgi:transcriptional regulator with XRE-family HTH domain
LVVPNLKGEFRVTNTKEIIIKLKNVREEKKLSYNDILALMEKSGDFVSKSTLSRIFSEGSEDTNFDYENTIRPIAKALLDMETIEDDDTMDVQALKTLLRYKIQRIEELEKQVKALEIALDKEKIKRHEKLDEIRGEYERKIDFLKEQIALKDKRMDLLLNSIAKKDALNIQMLQQLLDCPCRKRAESENA